jgi:hypothetical protein
MGQAVDPSHDLLASAQAQQERQRTLAKEAVRKAARQQAALTPGQVFQPSALRGKSVHYVSQPHTVVQHGDFFGAKELTVIDGSAPFHVAVASDITQVSNLLEVCIRLHGGQLVSSDVFLGLRKGPYLTFLPATQTRREIWISDRFRASSPDISKAITRIALGDDSKWACIASVAEFEVAKRKAAKANASSVLGLATHAEVTAIRASHPAIGKHVFELPEFMSFVSRVDVSRSRNGVQ